MRPAPETPLLIAKGSRGRIVAELQRALDVTADGVCGPVTMGAAFAALQRQTIALDIGDLWELGVDIHLGVDLSGHNEGGGKALVDFRKLKAAGVTFAILKLTEGNSYTNTEAARQVGAARDAGIRVGGYHFADPSTDRRGQTRDALLADARAEADRYLNAASRLFGAQGPDIIDWLDVEAGYLSKLRQMWAASPLGRSGAARAEATAAWCKAWLEAVPAAGIYTARWAVQAYLSAAPAAALQALTVRPLWLASYNAGAEPTRPLPHPWRPYHAWQCSGSGGLPGVDGKVDLNIALGSDLRALLRRRA